MEQGTAEWFAARCGRVTASRVADLIARTKTGWGASRADYMAELVAERLTGAVADSFTSAAMQWGTAMEPAARDAYEALKGVTVTRVGFIDHPKIAMSGASPDGLVEGVGLVEIKCPKTATHIDTMLGQKVPPKYVTQMQWQMACTGRDWCDFVSYDPRMPERMQLWCRRVMRDERMIADLERDVSEFITELDAKVAALLLLYGGLAA